MIDWGPIRALTVRPPWSWAIIGGGKRIENRSTLWRYRGPLIIHAGCTPSRRGYSDPRVQRALLETDTHEIEVGSVIGLVDLVDVHWAGVACGKPCDEWAEHGYPSADGDQVTSVTHLVTENPQELEPIPWRRGMLGLWTPPEELLLAVQAQIEAA